MELKTLEKREDQEESQRETVVQIIIILLAAAVSAFFLYLNYGYAPVNVYNVSANSQAVTSAKEQDSLAGNNTETVSPLVSEPAVEEAQEVLMARSVNINRANEEELDKLPGIGPVLARRIVQYREENGGFLDVDELLEVDGIGEITLEKIRIYLTAE